MWLHWHKNLSYEVHFLNSDKIIKVALVQRSSQGNLTAGLDGSVLLAVLNPLKTQRRGGSQAVLTGLRTEFFI